MDPRRFLVPAIGLLVVLAVAALLLTRDDDDDGERLTVGSDGTTTTVEETTTTTEAPTTTTAAPTTTTTTAPPTTVTTAPRPTTTAAPARTWSISPTSGPPNTEFTASGTGCFGQDAGTSITMYDPNGQAYNGDGGAAMPDGTWRLPANIGNVPPGRYTIKAGCSGSQPFQYAQVRTFTVT